MLNISREVRSSIEPEIDFLGRRHPQSLTGFTLLRTIPGLAAQFKAIPDEFWSQDVSDQGASEAVVACPCGEEPRVEVGRLRSCQCDRCFFFAGERVLVANSPVTSD